jgi:hypothetical protein
MRPHLFRNPAAIVLAMCVALCGIVQGAASTRDIDSTQSSVLWQQARDHAAMAPAIRVPHIRTAHLHRSPVFSLKFSGFPAAAPPLLSRHYASGGQTSPRSCVVLPRSGRSPPCFL